MPQEELLAKLQNARDQLLMLHKVLLDYQKHIYESTQHKVVSPAMYFELVTQHPDFAWLKTLSELIVSVDTLLDGKDFDQTNAENMLSYTIKLLNSHEPLNEFGKKYLEAKQASPAVALAHAKALQSIN